MSKALCQLLKINILMKKTKLTLKDIVTSNFHINKINIKVLGYTNI